MLLLCARHPLYPSLVSYGKNIRCLRFRKQRILAGRTPHKRSISTRLSPIGSILSSTSSATRSSRTRHTHTIWISSDSSETHGITSNTPCRTSTRLYSTKISPKTTSTPTATGSTRAVHALPVWPRDCRPARLNIAVSGVIAPGESTKRVHAPSADTSSLPKQNSLERIETIS